MTHDGLQFGFTIMTLEAAYLAVLLLFSQERSRTNVLLSGSTLLIGLAIGTTPRFLDRVHPDDPDPLARLQGMFEVGAVVTFGILVLSLLESSSLDGRRARIVSLCGWAAIPLAGWHAIASSVWPAQRLNDFEMSLGDPGALATPGFWLFAVFWMIAAVPFSLGWGLLAFGGNLDPAEARRAQAFVLAFPLPIAMTVVPPRLTGFVFTFWICTIFFGQLQYTRIRAERGVFLSRFLSPRVTDLVARQGLAEAMQPHHADLTVVSADLRGFTSYSEGVPSQSVVNLLTEYYDAVGEVAGRHGATITSYAGDGVMILVGAPLADPNHAAIGIRLARELGDAVEPVLERWRTPRHSLGLGIGVASGGVTVGAISAETRMEYTAIGMAVNLAARLCAAAGAGEVLVDAQAARQSKDPNLNPKGEMEIKGFSDAQHVYVVG